MLDKKTPPRVNAGTRPEFGPSALIEVVKRNGEFRKWGWFWGPILYLRTLSAARPRRSILWRGLLAVGTALYGLLWQYGWPSFLSGVAS